jgi:HEAT repeat protein
MTIPSVPSTAPLHSSQIVDPLPDLLRQLGDDDPNARMAAVVSLGRLGSLAIDALPALSDLLDDDDSRVRKAAARTLGLMGLPALSHLAKALEHHDKDVRRQAVWGIGRLGPQAQPALPALCQALKDSDTRTASGAAQALLNMGPKAEPAIPALLAALQNVNLVQCRLIAKALSEIGPTALPALIQALRDSDYYVRREVAVALGFMGMRAAPAVGPILNCLIHCTPPPPAPPRQTGLPANELAQNAPTPVKPIQAEPGDDRLVLIETLARIGPAASEARDYLIKTLNDHDRRVAEAAAQALLRIMGWN